MEKIKLGFLACHSDNYYALENKVIDRCLEGLRKITEFYHVELTLYCPITDEAGAKKARLFFEEEKIDYLLLLNASFSGGEIMMAFDGWKIPMGCWAVPDLKQEGDIELNAVVSTNMYVSIARRAYQNPEKIKWFYGYPDSGQFKKRLSVTLQALRGYKAIKQGTIGVLGKTAPGFFNLAVDEIVESSLGLTFTHLSMEEFIEETKLVRKSEIEKMKEEIVNSADRSVKVLEKSLYEGAKVLAALIRLTERHHISAWAASCWPDFQESFSIVPCVPFTLLSKIKGVPVACEGDVGGAISLLAAKEISEHLPALMDVASFDFENEKLLLWHCGIGSADFQPDKDVSIITHPMLDRKNPNRERMGLAYNYLFREMPVTILRYSNNHKIFAAEGRVISDRAGYTGTRGYITDFTYRGKPVHLEDIAETIMGQGIEHHLIVCPGRIEEALRECAVLNGISWMDIELYRNGL